MLRVVVMVSGGGTNLQAILDAVKDGKITNTEIVGVISNKKYAYALTRAKQAGLPAVCVSVGDYAQREDFNRALQKAVDSFAPDLVVLAGFLVILPEELVKNYKNRMINIHPALLPSFGGKGYYGLKVHEEVLARGCKVTGATVHFVDGGCDSGPILLQKAVEVKHGDTKEVLQQRVMEEAEWKILPQAIDLIANGRVVFEDGRAFAGE
ncbi:MAG: phosphoribosylglycinamide formyltransferase [Lachnospiraceae bacterium]|nr:phosphoribosylglycinamide formyltransferase [Lachnospiraceae bacterium]